jgi:hypothetical protein
MINFRFHLISLVAVFLALGVGVAAGASFVNRATVESLQGRVEDLDGAYRDRGAELDALGRTLGSSDEQAAALAAPGREALADTLTTQPVALVVSDGVPAELLNAVRSSLSAAGAAEPTVVRLLPAVGLEDAPLANRVRAALQLPDGDATATRRRVNAGLGAALAALSGPDPLSGATTPSSTVPPAGADPTVPTDVTSALRYLSVLDEQGVISVESSAGITLEAFGGGSGVRYLEILSPTDQVSTTLTMIPLAQSVAGWAPAVMTVAAAIPQRGEGAAPTTTTATEPTSDALVELRRGKDATRLSTVDDLQEAFGRIAAVYAIAEQQQRGTVGQYGTGTGASAPFPTVPAG